MGALEPALALTGALVAGTVGGLAGLVPGLHANTLATGVLLSALAGWIPRAWTPPLLMGLMGAWTFANVVPLIVLGVPEGADAPALLPGQRMARRGLAREAVLASARGSLTGLAGGSAAALSIAWVYAHAPLGAWLSAATPWIQGGALLALVLTDPAGALPATGVALLAGALGVGALGLPVASPLGLPATPLAPLFIGLFGVPALRRASQAGQPLGVEQTFRPRPSGASALLRAGLLGTALGTLAGAVAGFTAGPATAIAAQLREADDADVLATTSAVNTTLACVATGLLHAATRTRTGVHAARLALVPPMPGLEGLAGDLALLAAGAVPGLLVLALAARHARRIAGALPRVAPGLLLAWVAIVGLETGLAGFGILVAGWATARAARDLGVRRSLLMSTLLVPGLAEVATAWL